MVVGIGKFREHFSGHEDHYAIIGGAACELLFDAAGLPFRATKDIDIVLCVEVVDPAFGKAFRAFLDAGGYQARQRSEDRKEFYPFHKPKDDSYPFMIELFARKPATIDLPADAALTPIPVEENIVSLSAILLDPDYYQALHAARREVAGVTIIDETLLVPFKARAVLDMTAREEMGEQVDSKNIRKHRNDVFRLVQLLPIGASIKLPDPIRRDLQSFVDLVRGDSTLDPRAFDVPLSRDEAISLLASVYDLT